jgi:hypothetical protein
MAARFSEMTLRGKAMFVVKVVACIVSFGFIFPNAMND